MKFSQLDLIRILEGIEQNLAIDAIISSVPYQDGLLKIQQDLTTAIENILFDQIGEVTGLADQFKSLFGQNIRSLIAYVTGNPLAAGSEYPDPSISIFESFWNFIKGLPGDVSESEEVENLKAQIATLNRRLDLANATIRGAQSIIDSKKQEYFIAWKSGRTSPTGNFYQRVYNILNQIESSQELEEK